MQEQWNKCLCLLLEGKYDEGWPRHEWIRSGRPEFKDRFEPTPTFGKPIWRGETAPITLLVNAEFGMGDTIHFWRFIPLVKDRVAHVVLRCDEDFKGLFRGVEVVGKDEPLPPFDMITHMMALPNALGVRKGDITGRPYLTPNPDRQPQRAMGMLSMLKFFKIGVCWGGNPFNPKDHRRSAPADLFRKLLVVDGMKLFSLYKLGEPPEGVIDMRGFMQDWNETAYLLGHMDLVITVDTAIAHLAGALGRPVWTLIEEDCDWRWGEEGSRTFWYDSMTLFRQTKDWATTIDGVAASLRGLLTSPDGSVVPSAS